MQKSQMLASVAIILGALALLLSWGATLALLDIVQGREPDLSLEWTVVWIALPVITLAQVVSIAALVTMQACRTRSTK